MEKLHVSKSLSSRKGMVSRDGPVSNRKPSRLYCCIFPPGVWFFSRTVTRYPDLASRQAEASPPIPAPMMMTRSEEHTSELQSRGHLVCRLLLEKKKQMMPSGKH